MSSVILGTCSLCRGPVAVDYNSSALPPEPGCRRCGAIPESPYGPVIPMRPRQYVVVAPSATPPSGE